VVAPAVRFNALAIFLTPFFSRAIDFNNRRSSLVQGRGRLTSFFLFISAPLRAGFYHGTFCLQCAVEDLASSSLRKICLPSGLFFWRGLN
jgi:hypothetical protein